MKKHSRYTMIELLVVMGIMAAVMSFLMPNFRRMAMGTNVSSAARQLAAAIAKTRTEAVLSGRPVALLLPLNDNNEGEKIMPNYRNHAYSIAYLDDKKTTLDFSRVDKAGWHMLPEGVLITCVSTNSDFTQANSSRWFDDKATEGKQYLRKIKGFDTKAKARESSYGSDGWHDYKVQEYKAQRTFEHAFIYERAGNQNAGYTSNSGAGGLANYKPPSSIYGIVFNPDGSLDTPEVSIYIAEGIMRVDTEQEGKFTTSGTQYLNAFEAGVDTSCTMLPTNVDINGNAVGAVRLDVNRFTGRVSIRELAQKE